MGLHLSHTVHLWLHANTAHGVVHQQQPLPHCQQNREADYWLQGRVHTPLTLRRWWWKASTYFRISAGCSPQQTSSKIPHNVFTFSKGWEDPICHNNSSATSTVWQVESILNGYIMVWCGSSTAAERKALHRRITSDPQYPSHFLF